MNQISCCVFDIETTNLSADFGVVLCGVIMPGGNGVKPKIFRADRYEAWKEGKRSNDRGIIGDLVKELAKYDIWIAHNGAKFDLPFLRTRLLKWDDGPMPSMKLIDPVLIARNKLRMSYNSLEKIAEHLGVNTKSEVRPDMRLRAVLDGDSEAMDYIVEHCVQDVMTLDRIAAHLKVYSTTFNTYGSGY